MIPFVEAGAASRKIAMRAAKICICILALLMFCGIGFAQTPPQSSSTMLGEVVGDDVSVMGQSSAIERAGAEAIAFANGSIIVVHSGKARVEFSGGGELDVCGPAKLTVLASGEALTIALSFGRVHLRFSASRPITIYTPLILATPLAVDGQPRDLTAGLANSGAMCFRAAHGAFRLQNQLTGDSVVVPQPSEVLLQGSSFANLVSAAGRCRCDFNEPVAKNRAPSPPLNTAPLQPRNSATSAPAKPPASPASSLASEISPASKPGRTPSAIKPSERNVPRSAASPRLREPARPSVQTAARKIPTVTLPPIGYDVKSPAGASEPLSVATLMLAKETVVQPRWIFHGLIIAPEKRIQSSTHRNSRANADTSHISRAPKSPKRSFWAKLFDFFTGRRAPCEGVGCS